MKKVPKLRFPEFSEEWEIKKSINIFDKVKNSVDVQENKYYRQLGIRSHGKGIFYKDEVVGKDLGNKRVFWVEPNVFIVNIVFAWERAVARTTENEIGMIASHRFPMYKPKDEILDLDYITYFFKTNKGKKLLELASPGGAGRNKTLGQKEFDDLNIILPKIEEQKKIGFILLTIDRKIQKQQEKVEALKDYKKGIIQKIFSQEIRFKKNNGEEYPKWKEKMLKECINHFGGTALESFVVENGDYKFISIGNYDKNGKYIDNGQRINATGKAKEKILNKNDLVMVLNDKTSTGDIIGSTILIDEDNKYIYNQRSERIKCNDNIIPRYMWLTLNSTSFRKKIFSITQGGTQIYVNFPNVKELNILIPCIQEQEKISDFLLTINEKLDKEQEKLDSLNQLKKGLLQQMFV